MHRCSASCFNMVNMSISNPPSNSLFDVQGCTKCGWDFGRFMLAHLQLAITIHVCLETLLCIFTEARQKYFWFSGDHVCMLAAVTARRLAAFQRIAKSKTKKQWMKREKKTTGTGFSWVFELTSVTSYVCKTPHCRGGRGLRTRSLDSRGRWL